MPAQALLNSIAERVLNTALAADPDSASRLKPVRGKAFRLQLTELPWPLTLTFCEDRVLFMGSDYDAIDGEVQTSFPVLRTLTDASKVTAALQNGTLSLQGDPIFAQHASQVILGLNIDWEEAFAGRLGDVPGFWLAQGMAKLTSLKPDPSQWQQWLGETLSEEKKITLGQVEYAIFCDDLTALEQRIRNLEAGGS